MQGEVPDETSLPQLLAGERVGRAPMRLLGRTSHEAVPQQRWRTGTLDGSQRRFLSRTCLLDSEISSGVRQHNVL
jgi:hypothetical protein